jgi:hypothetical protein
MAVSLSDLRAGRSLSPSKIPGTHFCYTKYDSLYNSNKLITIPRKTEVSFIRREKWNKYISKSYAICGEKGQYMYINP